MNNLWMILSVVFMLVLVVLISLIPFFLRLAKKQAEDAFLKFLFKAENIPVLGGWIQGFRGLAEEGKTITDNLKDTVEQSAEQKALAEKLAKLQARLDKMAAEALNKQKKITKENNKESLFKKLLLKYLTEVAHCF